MLERKGFRNGLGEGLTEDAKGGRHCEIAGGSELVRARPNEQRAGASTVDTEAAETNRESQSEPISAVEAESNVPGPAGALGGSTTKGPSNGAEGEALAVQETYGRLHSSAIQGIPSRLNPTVLRSCSASKNGHRFDGQNLGAPAFERSMFEKFWRRKPTPTVQQRAGPDLTHSVRLLKVGRRPSLTSRAIEAQ